jgi:hypothetical protein
VIALDPLRIRGSLGAVLGEAKPVGLFTSWLGEGRYAIAVDGAPPQRQVGDQEDRIRVLPDGVLQTASGCGRRRGTMSTADTPRLDGFGRRTSRVPECWVDVVEQFGVGNEQTGGMRHGLVWTRRARGFVGVAGHTEDDPEVMA